MRLRHGRGSHGLFLSPPTCTSKGSIHESFPASCLHLTCVLSLPLPSSSRSVPTLPPRPCDPTSIRCMLNPPHRLSKTGPSRMNCDNEMARVEKNESQSISKSRPGASLWPTLAFHYKLFTSSTEASLFLSSAHSSSFSTANTKTGSTTRSTRKCFQHKNPRTGAPRGSSSNRESRHLSLHYIRLPLLPLIVTSVGAKQVVNQTADEVALYSATSSDESLHRRPEQPETSSSATVTWN